MKTQINIQKETKDSFEKLRAELSGHTGTVMTQNEALAWLIKLYRKVGNK